MVLWWPFRLLQLRVHCLGSTLKKYKPEINTSLFASEKVEIKNPPSVAISFFVALLPVFLLTYSLWYNLIIGILPEGMEQSFNNFSQMMKDNFKIHLLIEPNFSLLISVLVAIYFLGIKQGKTMPQVGKLLEEAFKKRCSHPTHYCGFRGIERDFYS